MRLSILTIVFTSLILTTVNSQSTKEFKQIAFDYDRINIETLQRGNIIVPPARPTGQGIDFRNVKLIIPDSLKKEFEKQFSHIQNEGKANNNSQRNSNTTGISLGGHSSDITKNS